MPIVTLPPPPPDLPGSPPDSRPAVPWSPSAAPPPHGPAERERGWWDGKEPHEYASIWMVPRQVSVGLSTTMPASMPRASRLKASVGQVYGSRQITDRCGGAYTTCSRNAESD